MTEQHHSRTRRQRKRRKKSRSSAWRKILALVLLLIGAALLALNPVKNMLIQQGTEVNRISHLTKDKIKENQKREVTYNFEDIESIDAAGVVLDRLSGEAEASELPTVGAIAVPELGINIPVHLGVSNAGMFLGAGTLKPDQEMGKGNYTLASHHALDPDLLFGPLLKAEMGQKIYLTDLENVYEYTIDFVEEVPAEAVHLLDETGEDIITLVTCDTGFVNRVVVRGTLTDTVAFEEADKQVLDAFDIEQNIQEEPA